MSFLHKVNWPDTASKFYIEGDTNALRFEKPKPRQKLAGFLENTQSYCEKDGDTFGERLLLEGAVAEEKKRKWQDVIDEPDEKKAWSLVRELEPRAWMLNHPSLERAIAKKRPRVVYAERQRATGEFRVPKLMELWMERYVIKRKWKGRPKALIIIGDPLTGKSMWAESQGRPIVMNSGWCMKSIFEVDDPTHIVVSDVKPLGFGYAGQHHWRDVIGGQASFNARDFQQEMRTIEWGLPCIWTCNFDSDPRKYKDVAEYIRRTAYVFEIRDRVGEKGWGKLYVPEKEEEDEGESDWVEALKEASEYMDTSGVDEAVDISFGI
jgi:hypothetical protein